ncbi:MAG: threonylcarbamoyl-AMP synthase [Candidatus Brocadiaceae bacterium]|nr:threonylcarbamoyl-AMP synthase [Candidatus Brocadiaceae bacterium]
MAVKTERLDAEDREGIRRAAQLLREGAIVAFPTDTVYGLGVRADDAAAVAELARLKRRPEGKEFACLVPDAAAARAWGRFDEGADALVKAFWPGALTIVVPGRGGSGTIGLRCPDCRVTREMLALVGVPVAAPSANAPGAPPARNAEDLLAEFDGRIGAVLDGGAARIGLPSTVVRIAAGGLEVLREGAIRAEALAAVLGECGRL